MLSFVFVGVALALGVNCPEPPFMMLYGDANYYVKCNEPYVEYGASAYSSCHGNLTDRITVLVVFNNMPVPQVDTSKPGVYTITYSVSDDSNPPLTASITRTVTVWGDVTVVLFGDEKTNWQCGIPYEDPGARAFSECAGDLTDLIRIDGLDAINVREVGKTYQLTYTLEHSTLQAPIVKTRDVTIKDTLEPTISVLGQGVDPNMTIGEDNVRWWDNNWDPWWWNTWDDRNNEEWKRYYRYIRIPNEKFFVQEYDRLYGSNKPFTMPPYWYIFERDGIGATDVVPLQWNCDVGYTDPGVEVWDDCEGRINPDEVLVIITRYLIRGYYYWLPWWPGVWDPSWRVDREVLQYIGTLRELRQNPIKLKEPGLDRSQVNSLIPHELEWGGYRVYYFVKDRLDNPTNRYLAANPTNILRMVRSRFIQPDYGAVFTGADDVVAQCGDTHISLDNNVRLIDKCIGDITATLSITGDYDPKLPGTYFVRYDGFGIDGRQFSHLRKFTVIDTIAPTINLIGSPVESIPWCVWRDGLLSGANTGSPGGPGSTGKQWWEQWYVLLPGKGFDALDSCDGNLSKSVFITGDGELREKLEFMALASRHLGTPYQQDWDIRPHVKQYTLNMFVKDRYGNSTNRIRIINVLPTKPEITFSIPSPLIIECGDRVTYTEPPRPEIWDITENGEWRCNAEEGDVLIERTEKGQFNTQQVNKYSVKYKVTNALLYTTEATYDVIVEDTKAPVLTVRPKPGYTIPVRWTSGVTFNWQTVLEVEALDQCDSAIVPRLTNRGGMDFASPKKGTYRLEFSATDGAGNTGKASVVVMVETVGTGRVPEITLLGASEIYLDCGTNFVDPGATAMDSVDGNLDDKIRVVGRVQIWNPGLYELVYSVANSEGTSASVVRKVHVQDDDPPSIVLRGLANMTVPLKERFVDPGAVAQDACDGVVQVVITGTVDTNREGTYTLTYNAQDSVGNAADPATRTVTVTKVNQVGDEQGEGEVREGEGEGEGEDEDDVHPCCEGCLSCLGRYSSLKQLLGDYLIVGLGLLVLLAWRPLRSHLP